MKSNARRNCFYRSKPPLKSVRQRFFDRLGKCFWQFESRRFARRTNGTLTWRPLFARRNRGAKERFIDRMFADDLNCRIWKSPKAAKNYSSGMLAGGFLRSRQPQTEARRQVWPNPILPHCPARRARSGKYRRIARFAATAFDSAGAPEDFSTTRKSRHGLFRKQLSNAIRHCSKPLLIEPLPAWSGSLTKRLMKTPKLFFTDTGLLRHY